MLTKRIIPCLDVDNGLVVKGRRFQNLSVIGNACELARKYHEDGADELIFLDITATPEKRKTMTRLAREISSEIFIPFTIGGGIKTVSDIAEAIGSGAEKVSINSAAVANPGLIRKASREFGGQSVVVAIDVKRKEKKWEVYVNSGKKATGMDAIAWARECEKLGAGELLVTSIDRDGMKNGYDIELIRTLTRETNLPIIASGGAGSLASIKNAASSGADGLLVASMLHEGKLTIVQIKDYLVRNKIQVRE